MLTILRSDWSPALRSTAHSIAAAVVAVYVAGYLLGAVIHAASDRLAGVRPAPSRTVLQFQSAARIPTTLPTISAPPLETLTVVQLRKLARQAGYKGLARSGRRVQLLEALNA